MNDAAHRLSGLRHGIACVVAVALAGCAEIAPPPGGPLDRAGPQLLALQPDSLAVRVPLDAPLVVTFSEKIDRDSFKNGLTLTPYRRIDAIDWDGPTVRVRPRGGWPADTTISVLLGSGILDRNLNAVGRPRRRTFSTGERVAPGVLAGAIRRTREAPAPVPGGAGAPPVGTGPPRAETPPPPSTTGPLAFVWVYRARGDSLPDPARDNPDYLTEAEPSGEFRIDGVAPGTYRLYAIHDGDRSRTFSAFRDYLTLAPDSLVVSAAQPDWSSLTLLLIDPKAPGSVLGRLAGVDTTGGAVDTLAWGVILSPRPAAGDTAVAVWPPSRATYQGRVEKNRAFALRGIAPGGWSLAAFRDLDNDGRWGRTEPLGIPVEILVEPAGKAEPPPLPRPAAAGAPAVGG